MALEVMRSSGSIVLVFGGLGPERFVSVASAINLSRNFDFSGALFIGDSGECHRVRPQILQNIVAKYTEYPEFEKQYLCASVELLSAAEFSADAVFFLALHGTYGEDGQIQKILDKKAICYTGSGYKSSSLAFEKLETKKIATANGVHIAATIPLEELDKYLGAPNKPLILKHKANGSSNGVIKFNGASELQVYLEKVEDKENYFIEEIVLGREFTCGIYENAEGQVRALEPVEIVHQSSFFDYQAKYTDKSVREICPCDLPELDKDRIKDMALKMHLATGCRGYSRSDFILNKDPYFLEINTLPGLSENSLYPKELRAEGIDMKKFIADQIVVAVQKRMS